MRPAAALFLSILFASAPVSAATDAERSAALAETDRALRGIQSDMRDFLSQPPARVEEATGSSWLDMGEAAREDEVVHAMAILGEHGIVFGRRPEHYAAAIQDTLQAFPERSHKPLVDILGGILYDTEPESRPALDKITLKRSI